MYQVYKIFFYTPDIPFQKLTFLNIHHDTIHLQPDTTHSAIIVFFQTWCGPCIAEMKLIQTHYNDFSFTKIYFISDEPLHKLSALTLRLRLDSLQVLQSTTSLKDLGIQVFPTSYILKQGQILETHKGSFIDESNFEDELFHLKEMLK